jgi:hypothetical protein
MPGLPSFISNESPEFKSAPVQALSHQVLVDAIMQAIRDVAVSGISITAANAAGRILSATRNETARQQLSQGQFGVDFYDAGGQASVQAPELMAFRLDGTEFRYVVPFPQAGRSSRFVIWFGPAEYKTNPVLAQQPAIGVVHGDGVLVKQRAGLLVSA